MTPDQACQEVITLLTSANISGVMLLPHDPTPGMALRQGTLTVTFEGMTGTDWLVGVRLYLGTAENPAGAETAARTVLPQVDAALSSAYPRTGWSRNYHAELVCTLLETTIPVGREDF